MLYLEAITIARQFCSQLNPSELSLSFSFHLRYDFTGVSDLVRLPVDDVEEHHRPVDPVSVVVGNGYDVINAHDTTGDVREKSV